jgi:hypothetical protein
MKKEDFINTKWDAREWTKEQKAKWQARMYQLGFSWGIGTKGQYHLCEDFYYVRSYFIGCGGDYYYFNDHRNKQMTYEDAFPSPIQHLEGQRAKARFDASIEATLTERGNNYGSFNTGAELMQSLKLSMRSHPKWGSLESYQQEALEMIQHKIARIINGDPSYVDSWHDIGGYAKLVEDILNK